MKTLKKQGGFTLLELLVVVGLMAAVAVVAVSTYDDADASASISTDLSNIQAIDQGVRNYAGKHNGNFPNQLDSLLTTAGDPYVALATDTKAVLQALPVAGTIGANILGNLEDNGIEELQFIGVNTDAGVYKKDPNALHPESSGNGIEADADTATKLTIVANKLTGTTTANTTCKVDTVDYSAANTILADTAAGANVLNAISDQFESNVCNIVVAFGVGGDAAANSDGAIGATSSDAVKDKATQYSRYLALFHVAQDGYATGELDGEIQADEVFAKPRFVGVINPLGQGNNALNKLKNTQ